MSNMPHLALQNHAFLPAFLLPSAVGQQAVNQFIRGVHVVCYLMC